MRLPAAAFVMHPAVVLYAPEDLRPEALAMRATTRLRTMLDAPGIIVAPGAYDGFSARLIGSPARKRRC